MKIHNDEIINWLLDSDVSLQYQVRRDLLNDKREDLRERIHREGWGFRFLSLQNKDAHWGKGFYQPKWISSHYTLLDLKHLNICHDILQVKQTIYSILKNRKGKDGGVNPGKTISESDVCVNGMFLNYASYFRIDEEELISIIDFLISQQMNDGGFNCHSNRKGAVHSSLHTTLSVAEGITEYVKNGYAYRKKQLQKAEAESREFILQHRLFRSDKTGKVIDKKFLMLSYPSRWRYDILRCLDYFRDSGAAYDERMSDAIKVILKKQGKDGKWILQSKHPGQTHFDMERQGHPSRWNTLRALRVLKHFGV
jgi:hypothetical protein